MEAERRTFLLRAVAALLVWSTLPYVAYRLADWYFGSAMLVGTYLFASPILALSVVGPLFFMAFPWTPKSRLAEAREVEELSNWFCLELGLPRMRVFHQQGPGIGPRPAVSIQWGKIILFSEPWSELGQLEREFDLAFALSRRRVGRWPWEWLRWAVQGVAFAAMVAASQNLWAILPMHTLSLAAAVFLPHLLERWITLKSDRCTLRLTRNLTVAESRISQWAARGDYLWLTLDARLEALRAAARELEIA